MSVRKHASIATIAVLGSRFAGLIREMTFAFFFGAGPALDAFIAAFRIPNLLRDLFAEGALSSAFVTVFSGKASKEGDKKAFELANRVMSFILVFVGILCVLGIIFSPYIVKALATGFTGEKYEFTVLLNRILFSFILFVSLAAVCMGMLNTKGKFALPQSASTFFNLTSIVAGLTLAFAFSPDLIANTFHYLFGGGVRAEANWDQISNAMIGMAVGTLLGGIVQFVVQLPALFKIGFKPKFIWNLKNRQLNEVLRLTVPAIIGGAAVQVNVMVNTNFASYLADGSISWLNYAFRLMQFPIGLFGVSVALATTPALARHVSAKDEAGFVKTLRDSTQLSLFLCIPAALGLIFLAEPIIGLVYQYGRFTEFDTLEAAHALMAYAVGLGFYALIKIYQPAFLSLRDARTPMLLSLSSIFINLFLNWLLVFVFHFKHWGLALGTSGVAIWNAVMLAYFLKRKIPHFFNLHFFWQIGKILIAADGAVFIGWGAYRMLLEAMGDAGLLSRAIILFPPIGVTVLCYYFLCSWMRVEETAHLKAWAKKFTKRFA